MTSFRKFLTENKSDFISKNYTYNKYDSYLNEEINRDKLQAMELEIHKKIQQLQEKLHKLQEKNSSLQTKINKILIDSLNGKTSGKEYSVAKQFEEYNKELKKTEKEIFEVFDKINSYYSEIQKIRAFSRGMNEARANKDGKFVPKTRKQLDKLVKDESIHLGDIDVSNITDFSGLFSYSFRKDFSGIEKWDVSHVRTMNSMFLGAKYFNEPIGNWNVGEVRDMDKMFKDCVSFNQDISRWNVSKVVSMSEMFAYCEKFNQDLDKWDVRNVRDVWRMLKGTKAFNQDLESWPQKNKNIKYPDMLD